MLQFAAERDDVLAQMFSKPDDLLQRRIAADWLIDFGDPLGELIALQLARDTAPASEQEIALSRTHARAWLHDLFYPERVREVVFELGVPVHLKVAREIDWRPACATVRSIEMIDHGSTDWLLTPRWSRVRHIKPIASIDPLHFDRTLATVERFGSATITTDVPRATLFLSADGHIELFVHEAPPPFAWVTELCRRMTPTRIDIYLADEMRKPRLPRNIAIAAVHRLPAEEVAAREYQRERELNG